MSLDVCLDRALESWILSFGPSARVVDPPELAQAIAACLRAALARYTVTNASAPPSAPR